MSGETRSNIIHSPGYPDLIQRPKQLQIFAANECRRLDGLVNTDFKDSDLWSAKRAANHEAGHVTIALRAELAFDHVQIDRAGLPNEHFGKIVGLSSGATCELLVAGAVGETFLYVSEKTPESQYGDDYITYVQETVSHADIFGVRWEQSSIAGKDREMFEKKFPGDNIADDVALKHVSDVARIFLDEPVLLLTHYATAQALTRHAKLQYGQALDIYRRSRTIEITAKLKSYAAAISKLILSQPASST
jgi:hypothetical protein